MNNTDLQGFLTFLKNAEQLKDTLRSAHTSQGRHESTAEHTWRLCLMVLLFEGQYPDVDILKLIKMCIIHDLGEAINGDIPAIEQQHLPNKSADERRDLQTLVQPLPGTLQQHILALWDEYESASSTEARLAKAFDKLETVLQHTQGQNPENFHYGFNLIYGKQYTDFDALTQALRALIDQDTLRLAQGNNTVHLK